MERCLRQIRGTLAALATDCAGRPGPYWFGDRIGHADIAVAACLRHANDAHPTLIDWAAHPALKAHCDRLEAMPVFREISQPFLPPA